MIRSRTLDISGGEYVAALGTFDGVHIGHKSVITAAASRGLPVAVVTSDVNPRKVIYGGSDRILSPDLCDDEFESLGVSAVIRLDFNEIRNMSPTEYLDMLVKRLGARGFTFGFNFRFGKNASGTPETLREYAAAHGLFCHECGPVSIDGSPVSSSRIRTAISDGNMEDACRLFGRYYAYDFNVCHGDARGKSLGFPTANQIFPDGYVVPRHGVYASDATIDGKIYRAVTNIGIRPTFSGKDVVSETHIIGFDNNIYNKKIKVELLCRLRDELRFDSADALIAQMEKDKQHSISISRDMK